MLVAFVAEKPDRTLAELCAQWQARHGTKLSTASMVRALRRAGVTRKKSFTPSEQERTDVRAKRTTFLETIACIEPKRLGFIDESGCNLAMATTHGRAPAGVRVADSKPANWGGNITMVGAIKKDRVVCHQTLEGAMNKPRFLDFVRKVLCPKLPKGSTLLPRSEPD